MASGEGRSNPSTSGDAGRDHHEDFGNEYGPPLPTQEELREMEHRRLVGEATNLMLNFAKDPKLAKYMSETAFQDVQAQLKATTTSLPKPDSKKQYSEKELEEELDARLARILGAQKQGKKHDRKRKKSTDFNGYLGSQSTFDKAKKHRKHAAVPSSSSSSESSSESSEEERRSKKRSRRHRHGKAKKKTKKSRCRRVHDSSTEDSSSGSSDSEDGHFYANKKNFYKANQYDFLEDKSQKVREFKEGGQSIKFETFSGYKDASKALSFIQQFDIAFAGGRYSEHSKIRRAASYFKGNARTWWSTLLLNKTAPKISFREQIERFTLGLPTEIRDHCLEQKSASIQELMSHAKRGFAIHSGSLTYPTDDGMTQREDQSAGADTKKRERYPEKKDARSTLTTQERSRLMREGKCFGCGEPGHISAKCPKKALNEKKDKDDDRPESSRAEDRVVYHLMFAIEALLESIRVLSRMWRSYVSSQRIAWGDCKVAEAIEAALQKLECPHLLQVHQIQGLDYPAVHLVMQWLMENSSTIQAKMCNQVFSLAIEKSKSFPHDANRQLKFEGSSSVVSDCPLSKDDDVCRLTKDPVVELSSEKAWKMESQPQHLSCQAVALLKQIAELEKTNRSLREQKTDLEVELLKTKEKRKGQEREESELVLETKIPKEKVGNAGALELVQNLLPLLEQSKVSPQEELQFQSSCRQQRAELLLEAEEKQCKEQVCKANVEPIFQQDIMKLKLLKGDMATKNQKFVLYRRKLDEVPSHTELMQYERCFVELYLRIQEKLQETRKRFATYNALAEANELTLKEISLLNSIHAQFEEVVKSQRGRTKLVASMSDIAKGMNQKVERMEARLLAEQNSLSALKKRHSQLVAERRRYENLMDLFQDACTRNELLRSSLHQET
ncbi:hypothetical protein L7F22_036560 [Adiantum nelumboides]|nr:hypothetical protein [Adiantum nelumboides]